MPGDPRPGWHQRISDAVPSRPDQLLLFPQLLNDVDGDLKPLNVIDHLANLIFVGAIESRTSCG